MSRAHCPCGWPKPTIAVARPDGSRIDGELLVRLVCPACETPYTAGERASGEVPDRVQAAAAGRDPMPSEAQAEWREEERRHMDAWLRFAQRWPNFGQHTAFGMLGSAIALVDCLGGDVEGFLKTLREREPRPDFKLVPNPKARS